jgi:hypothetical protein
VEVVDFKEITKIKEEEVEETEIEVEKVADQALVVTDQQKGLEEISQQKDLEKTNPQIDLEEIEIQKDLEKINPQIDLEEIDIQKDLSLKIPKVLKNTNQEKAVKKTTEEKVTEKSQNFLVKNLKTSKIEISIQVIEKIIRIKNHLIKRRV